MSCVQRVVEGSVVGSAESAWHVDVHGKLVLLWEAPMYLETGVHDSRKKDSFFFGGGGGKVQVVK